MLVDRLASTLQELLIFRPNASDGDDNPNDEETFNAIEDQVFVILRDLVAYRLIGIDAFEPLVVLWLNRENDEPVSRNHARSAAADAFLVGFYAREIVARELSNKEVMGPGPHASI